MHYMRIIALLICIAPPLSNAATVYGFGTHSCGQWLEERGKNSDSSRYHQVWVLGFISGTGVILEANNINQRKTDAHAVMAYVDKYCRENPLDDIQRASQTLVLELMGTE